MRLTPTACSVSMISSAICCLAIARLQHGSELEEKAPRYAVFVHFTLMSARSRFVSASPSAEYSTPATARNGAGTRLSASAPREGLRAFAQEDLLHCAMPHWGQLPWA